MVINEKIRSTVELKKEGNNSGSIEDFGKVKLNVDVIR